MEPSARTWKVRLEAATAPSAKAAIGDAAWICSAQCEVAQSALARVPARAAANTRMATAEGRGEGQAGNHRGHAGGEERRGECRLAESNASESLELWWQEEGAGSRVGPHPGTSDGESTERLQGGSGKAVSATLYPSQQMRSQICEPLGQLTLERCPGKAHLAARERGGLGGHDDGGRAGSRAERGAEPGARDGAADKRGALTRGGEQHRGRKAESGHVSLLLALDEADQRLQGPEN